MRTWNLALVAVAGVIFGSAIVLAATDSGSVSADERFAIGVCEKSLPWVRQMLDVFDDAVHTRAAPGNDDGWLPLYGKAYRGQEIARKYGAAIRALRVPDTPAGRDARRFLGWWSRQPLQTMKREERRVWKLGGDRHEITLRQSIRGLNQVELSLVRALGDMGTGIVLYVPELVDRFSTAEPCKRLRALVSNHETE
jgi:hypothetical protein